MSLLLHLSDLHLGPVRDEDIPDDFKSDIPPLSERTTRYTILEDTLTQLSSQLRQAGEQLDAVVVSGDITVKNDERGFQKLDEVLSWLGDARPTPEKTIIVPGNHDVMWGVPGDSPAKYEFFKKYVRDKGFITPLLEGIDLKDENVVANELARHYLLDSEHRWAIVPINSSHYCGSVEPIAAIPEDVWKELPAMIAGRNPDLDQSAVIRELRDLRLRDVARISVPDQLKAIRQLVTAIKTKVANSSRRPVLIGVLHHHLLPVSIREEFKPFESITNLGHLRYVLRDNNFAVVLHGHKHADYVYFDHVHRQPNSDVGTTHRLLVISAPHLKTPSAKPEIVGRLIGIPDQEYASSIWLKDIPSVEHGIQLQLPKPTYFRLWQPPSDGLLRLSPVNLVEGKSVDEVYERALALFLGLPSSELLPNLVCRVVEATDPVPLPAAYPPVEGVSEAERPAWFRRIVDWWQKRTFNRLSGDHHFNHGSRIHRYNRNVPQLDRVIEAIEKDRATSRGVITLLNPHADEPQKESSRFPSFCFVQFLVRDLGDRYSLDVIGHFRKQEIKYWWPVNVTELSRLQAEVLHRVKAGVERDRPKPLAAGVITTIAATAHVGTKIPYILVPAIDFDLEESPQKLWDMTYAVCWDGMADRPGQVMTWQNVLTNLIPPNEQDSDGVPVPIQGVEFLAEIAEHFARNHGGDVRTLGLRWRELERINREHAKKMAAGKIQEQEHDAWRREVLTKLNDIGGIVGRVFNAQIGELR